jgi:hypothetical protein
MFRLIRTSLFAATLLCAAPLLLAQTPPTPAPVPAPLHTAQKLFLANAGMDAFSLQAFEELGLAKTDTYDSLYKAIQGWKSYQLVSSPEDADLVLEVHTTAPFVGNHDGFEFQHVLATTTWQFQSEVTILDARTHLLLWAITQPVRPANLHGTWRKNVATANAALAGQLQALLAPPPPANP